MWGLRVYTGFVICLGLLVGLCRSAGPAPRLVAIASIFPVADLAQRVGGERWEVLTLIPAGASVHTYEPTPEQVRQFSQARVFFRIGLGLEFWLEKLVQAAHNPALRNVDLSAGIHTLSTPTAALLFEPSSHEWTGHDQQSAASGEESSHEGPHHEAADPHYWLDPVQMQAVVMHMAHVLAALDPDHAAGYRQRAEHVKLDVAHLHQEILQRTQGLAKRRFIGMHSAWTYFAPRYHLEQVAVIEPFPGREPSPRYLAELATLMQRQGVDVVVSEPQLNPAAAQALARETHAKVGILDPLGGPGVPGRNSYVALMRWNVAQLIKLLQ